MIYIAPEILERVNQWLVPFFDHNTQQEIKEMIANDPKGVEDSFYKNLEFGTGGMRGIMGPGDNRINKYTLGKNTQGLSQYLKQEFPGEDLKVAIAYDCRHNSKSLAAEVANVFSANGITVYLFSDLRPTPELSFAVKHLNCHCGIVLTASHNPPEYNGYKVYWQDGGQLVPPQDKEIIAVINKLAYTDIQFEGNSSLIHKIDTELDEAFIKASLANGMKDTTPEQRAALKVVFTPLHGTSVTVIPEVLKRAGYSQMQIVEAQATPDGDFPTVVSPNPEEPEALSMAMQIAEQSGADMVIGTDPDSDRLGIAVRDEHGKMTILNGNQAMVIKTHFLLAQKAAASGIKANDYIASTIVSTPMMGVMAEDFGLPCELGLTGFKWIAKMVKDMPEKNLIGGGEESFGFMVGDFVRDKDAVTASLLACEIAAQQKAKGETLLDYAIELYKKYGVYQEELISFVKPGKSGAEEIQAMMKSLRETPLKEIVGEAVVRIDDFQNSISTHPDGSQTAIDMPKSNVLIYWTAQGTKVAARPSGTEPKIKFYLSANAPWEGDYRKTQTALLNKMDRIAEQFNLR
ncbi:phospho-sugar mutase [Gilvibacter sp. SZ-19]|uniref:phospho-sugar mutase n=1 Tax=Gilvibacter sp. SZ-19 TaxID=754429 RepID=UPI0018DF928B|nr:phospho-sugar mutase [Gilvibacter sp. SZ-19]